MSEHVIISIAHHWFDAFNEHNLEKLLALYHENACHYSPKLKLQCPETKGLIQGKSALHSWWQNSFDRLPTLQYVPTRYIVDNSAVFMEYMRYVEREEPIAVGEVLEINDGLIVASRVYHG